MYFLSIPIDRKEFSLFISLYPIVVPFAINYDPDFLLVDDNARPQIIMEFLQANNVRRMNWPAKSADLNIIQHVWSNFKMRVRSRGNPPKTFNDLCKAI